MVEVVEVEEKVKEEEKQRARTLYLRVYVAESNIHYILL